MLKSKISPHKIIQGQRKKLTSILTKEIDNLQNKQKQKISG